MTCAAHQLFSPEPDDNLVVFPVTRHKSWRAVEAVALRMAGGANSSVRPALNYVADHWKSLPPERLNLLLEATKQHIKARVEQHRQAVGNTQLEPLPEPAKIVQINGPHGAA